MTDRDRLAADLRRIDYMNWTAAENADRLIALGWTRLDRIGACDCSICDDRGVPCPNHSDICANCHRECWGSVYPLDVDRLARALHPIVDEQIADEEWGEPGRTHREMAAAIAKAYREDTDAG